MMSLPCYLCVVAAIATVILAGDAILWLVYYAIRGVWFMVRRQKIARRQRRGECTNCGYSLRGNESGRCPECGTAITEMPTR